MKIFKEVEFSQMVEIEIGSDDIIEAIDSLKNWDESDRAYTRALNSCLSLIMKIPDSTIEKLSEESKKLVENCMLNQISRYKK